MATKPDEDFEEDLDESAEPDEAFDEEDLEDDDVVAVDVVVDDDDDDAAVIDLDATEEDDDEEVAKPARARKTKAADEEVDEDEEVDPDDVEADLDTILKDRIAAADDEEDEDEVEEVEAPGENGGRVQPMKASEFLCKSCFLVKSTSQRVDGTDDLCNDCV
jgi:hypothetical protein